MTFSQLEATMPASPLTNQKGMVIWLMGLSGAGKSTIAQLLKNEMGANGVYSVILDGDAMRETICSDLGFSPEDRLENVRRVAGIAQLLAQNNVVAICSLITPLHEHQQKVRDTVKTPYFEVFVDCPVTVCESRDVKGLYLLARENIVKNFTGISAPFCTPVNPDLVLKTADQNARESMLLLYEQVIDVIAITGL
jgi:adenylyl-sulfate kinase